MKRGGVRGDSLLKHKPFYDVTIYLAVPEYCSDKSQRLGDEEIINRKSLEKAFSTRTCYIFHKSEGGKREGKKKRKKRNKY